MHSVVFSSRVDHNLPNSLILPLRLSSCLLSTRRVVRFKPCTLRFKRSIEMSFLDIMHLGCPRSHVSARMFIALLQLTPSQCKGSGIASTYFYCEDTTGSNSWKQLSRYSPLSSHLQNVRIQAGQDEPSQHESNQPGPRVVGQLFPVPEEELSGFRHFPQAKPTSYTSHKSASLS